MPSRSERHFNVKRLAPFCRQYLNGTILQKIIYLLNLIRSDLRQYLPSQPCWPPITPVATAVRISFKTSVPGTVTDSIFFMALPLTSTRHAAGISPKASNALAAANATPMNSVPPLRGNHFFIKDMQIAVIMKGFIHHKSTPA